MTRSTDLSLDCAIARAGGSAVVVLFTFSLEKRRKCPPKFTWVSHPFFYLGFSIRSMSQKWPDCKDRSAESIPFQRVCTSCSFRIAGPRESVIHDHKFACIALRNRSSRTFSCVFRKTEGWQPLSVSGSKAHRNIWLRRTVFLATRGDMDRSKAQFMAPMNLLPAMLQLGNLKFKWPIRSAVCNPKPCRIVVSISFLLAGPLKHRAFWSTM